MKTLQKLPEYLLDREGYPTDEWLQFIKDYKPDESLPILTFIREFLINGWWMSDWGIKIHRQYKKIIKLELHTGGWSGNEDIIEAILSNIYLTHFSMKYIKWLAGGHYYFEIYVK